MKLRKCFFMKEELVNLGFIISHQGLTMDPEKVKTVFEWHMRKNYTKIRIIHGIATFYRNFINDFSHMCAPLITCMKKGEFKWTKTAHRTFERLKKKVT